MLLGIGQFVTKPKVLPFFKFLFRKSEQFLFLNLKISHIYFSFYNKTASKITRPLIHFVYHGNCTILPTQVL
jgi:hypothetical protein